MRQILVGLAKRVLPDRFIGWYRRRRALRKYLRDLAYEIYDRQVRLDLAELEDHASRRRHGFQERVMRDLLERTDLILQQLDRRIEGLNARHGGELRSLREELDSLRGELARLQRRDEAPADAPTP